MSSVTEKLIYQDLIELSKEKQLKSLLLLGYDRISLALTSELETVERHCG